MIYNENDGRAPGAQPIHTLIRSDGRVTGYVLSNGMSITKEQADEMASQGKIDLSGTMS